MTKLAPILQIVPERAGKVFKEAEKHCDDVATRCNSILGTYMAENSLDPEGICFVAIGSVGRREALYASDLDFIPILKNAKVLQEFRRHDKLIRDRLAEELKLHISQGEDLTACVTLDELTDQEAIGGEKDSSSALTKRVLVLSEGKELAGQLALKDIRNAVLEAYASHERTSGRHALSLCNDLARYYRTLCIEYKAKVDVYAKDWCTRNLKLRHSRKFWYFSTMLSIVSLSERHLDSKGYIDALTAELEEPPYLRLLSAAKGFPQLSFKEILERYAYFLDFMAKKDHRDALSAVEHTDRYVAAINNPFPVMKLNSDVMQTEMVRIICQLPQHVRDKVFEWFLL